MYRVIHHINNHYEIVARAFVSPELAYKWCYAHSSTYELTDLEVVTYGNDREIKDCLSWHNGLCHVEGLMLAGGDGEAMTWD